MRVRETTARPVARYAGIMCALVFGSRAVAMTRWQPFPDSDWPGE